MIQQLGSDMEENQEVPGGWEEAKQMQRLEIKQNPKWTAERRWWWWV